jgi:hypothetical protein
MSDLQQELQHLIAFHGVGKVYTGLYKKMKEDYEFLHDFFSADKTPRSIAPKKKVVPSIPSLVVPDQDSDITDMSASTLRDAKIRIVKKEVAPVEPDPLALFPPVTEEVEVEEAVPAITSPVVKPPTFKNPKEAKEWQKGQELQKKQDNIDSGITPNSLLTKENLERWIIQESRTYAYIAREYVGLPEAMISESAKAFGIQSEASKKRNEMIKKRKVHQKQSS